jgi:CheY-like chemotaxis protein
MRVLVADDDADVRTMVAEFLTPHGVQVVEATDGVETLGQVTRHRLDGQQLDAIVMELQMPRLGGVEALRRIRAVNPSVTVIVLTGAIEPALHRRARASGACGIFLKPADLPTLWAAIEGNLTSSPAYAVSRGAVPVTRPASQPPRDTRVLVVDDDAAVRETVVEFLDRRGYQTSVAVDGTNAVQALLREPADIVLLDIHMPGLTGVDALPTLRAIAPHAVVIMVTANIDLEVARRTLAHGAFDYLLKPINFADLGHSLAMAIQMKALDETSAGIDA